MLGHNRHISTICDYVLSKNLIPIRSDDQSLNLIMTEILDGQLYLGSKDDVNWDLIRHRHIQCIINVAHECNYMLVGKPQIILHKFDIVDDFVNIIQYFDIISSLIHGGRSSPHIPPHHTPIHPMSPHPESEGDQGAIPPESEGDQGAVHPEGGGVPPLAIGPVLIHCVAGISRSPSFVIAYLIKYQHMTLYDAYNHVLKRRNIMPNPCFMRNLMAYEQEVLGLNTFGSFIENSDIRYLVSRLRVPHHRYDEVRKLYLSNRGDYRQTIDQFTEHEQFWSSFGLDINCR